MGKRLFFSVVFGVLLCFGIAGKAQAIGCNQAHVFVTGETLTASILNANPANFVTCFTQIDNTNVGALGFYASQVIPTTVGQATFGGTQSYTFSNGLTVNGTFMVNGSTLTPPWSVAIGGTNLTSLAGTKCIRSASTLAFAEAAGDCVTNVTGSGNIASSGGTTPNITFTGTLPVANGGTNLTSLAGSKCIRSSSTTAMAEAAGDCVTNVTGTAPIASSGGTTPAISCSTCLTTTANALKIYNSSGTVLSSGPFILIHTVQFSCSADGNGNCTTGTVTWTTAFTSSSTYNLGGCTYIAGGAGVVAALEPISTTSADAKMKGNGSTTLTLNCDLIGY